MVLQERIILLQDRIHRTIVNQGLILPLRRLFHPATLFLQFTLQLQGPVRPAAPLQVTPLQKAVRLTAAFQE
jgi:hypothetical protein